MSLFIQKVTIFAKKRPKFCALKVLFKIIVKNNLKWLILLHLMNLIIRHILAFCALLSYALDYNSVKIKRKRTRMLFLTFFLQVLSVVRKVNKEQFI